MSEIETRFADGNLSDVVRVGDTVRRVPGPWSPAVQALLRHLETVGFDGAPRFLGMDERGREVLSFVEGETPRPDIPDWSEALLAGVGRLLRRYHDAVAGFIPPPGAEWQVGVGAPTQGDVVCHNDAGPWNVVVRDRVPVALIDWDLAAPAPRAWDVAYALWRFVPFYQSGALGSLTRDFGTPAQQGQRARVFCDANGLDAQERIGLVGLVEWRIRVSHDTLASRAAAGDPAWVRMWEEGHGVENAENIAYLRRHRAEIERHLLG
jgi:Ser/Thr protein kinase RdoA (MazF antagonist)